MKRFRKWLFKRRVRQAVRMLSRLDASMRAGGFTRDERKQIWRDFIKNKSGRDRVSDLMTAGIL